MSLLRQESVSRWEPKHGPEPLEYAASAGRVRDSKWSRLKAPIFHRFLFLSLLSQNNYFDTPSPINLSRKTSQRKIRFSLLIAVVAFGSVWTNWFGTDRRRHLKQFFHNEVHNIRLSDGLRAQFLTCLENPWPVNQTVSEQNAMRSINLVHVGQKGKRVS